MSAKFVSWEEAVRWLINQPDKQELVKDCYYDPSVQDAANRYWKSDEWQAVKTLLKMMPGKALDLGAGRGIASFALAKDGWQVQAIEPDSSDLVGAGAIELLARNNNLPINVTKEFGEEINCESASIDLVFARQVLHHANDLVQLCAELFRVLKPGGQFIAVRDHVVNSPADLQSFYDKHPLHNLYGGEHAYTEKEYVHAMKKAGFQVHIILRSFDSVINFAPYTGKTFRAALIAKLNNMPIVGLLSVMLNNKWIYSVVLKLLSQFDNRPGRLYSFVCFKPEN